MKYKMTKDVIRVKMNKTEYNALMHLMLLANKYNFTKSIEEACTCADMVYHLFVTEDLSK